MAMKRSESREKTAGPAEKPSRTFEQRVRLSWLSVLGERLWEALLWPFLVVTTFLVLTLFDVWRYLPSVAHRGFLLAFGCGALS
jgi:hypothetical protein